MRRNATIVRPGATDRFGDPVAPAVEFTDSAAWVVSLESSSDSFNGQRNDAQSRVNAYVLGATKAVVSDLVRIDGRMWQVDGHPVRAESPFTGRLAGYTVSLKQFEG